jgi:hypothetical protein
VTGLRAGVCGPGQDRIGTPLQMFRFQQSGTLMRFPKRNPSPTPKSWCRRLPKLILPISGGVTHLSVDEEITTTLTRGA